MYILWGFVPMSRSTVLWSRHGAGTQRIAASTQAVCEWAHHGLLQLPKLYRLCPSRQPRTWPAWLCGSYTFRLQTGQRSWQVRNTIAYTLSSRFGTFPFLRKTMFWLEFHITTLHSQLCTPQYMISRFARDHEPWNYSEHKCPMNAFFRDFLLIVTDSPHNSHTMVFTARVNVGSCWIQGIQRV